MRGKRRRDCDLYPCEAHRNYSLFIIHYSLKTGRKNPSPTIIIIALRRARPWSCRKISGQAVGASPHPTIIDIVLCRERSVCRSVLYRAKRTDFIIYSFLFKRNGLPRAYPLAVPDNVHTWSVAHLSTATPTNIHCFIHRMRSYLLLAMTYQ